MEITIKELKAAEPILTQVLDSPQKNPKVAYALLKIRKKLISEFENIETMRVNLVKEHATKNAKGEFVYETDADGMQIYTFEPEAKKAFEAAYQEQLNTNISFDVWQIPFAALEGLNLSVNALSLIESFVTEPDVIEG